MASGMLLGLVVNIAGIGKSEMGRLSTVWVYVASTLLIAAVGLGTYGLHIYTRGVNLSSLLLFATVLISYRYGVRPGIYAALLATLAYFLAVGAMNTTVFIINGLVGFGGAALLTGLLVGRLRAELDRAQGRARLLGVLLAAAQDLASAPDEPTLRARLSDHLSTAAGADAVIRDDLRQFCEENGLVSGPLLDNLVNAEERRRTVGRFTQQIGPWDVRTLTAGQDNLGIAAWRRSDRSAEEQTLLAVLVDTGALALARERASAA